MWYGDKIALTNRNYPGKKKFFTIGEIIVSVYQYTRTLTATRIYDYIEPIINYYYDKNNSPYYQYSIEWLVNKWVEENQPEIIEIRKKETN